MYRGPNQVVYQEEAENQHKHTDHCPSLDRILQKQLQEESTEFLKGILAQLKCIRETGDMLSKELRLNSRAISQLKAMVALQGGTTSTQSLSQEPDRLAELEANMQNTTFREDWVFTAKAGGPLPFRHGKTGAQWSLHGRKVKFPWEMSCCI